MPGYKTYCRFENSRVAWNHCGYGFVKEYSSGRGGSIRSIELKAQDLLKLESKKAAAKFMQNEPVNTMGLYWPK